MANTYTVVSGDTLSGIAAKTGVSMSSITGYKSGNPNLIYPGEVLTLGGSPAPAAAPAAPAAPASTQTPTTTPQVQQQSTPQPQSGVDPHINPSTGVWDDNYYAKTYGGASSGGSGGISSAFSSTVPALNLPDLYTSLSKSAGISDMEKELTTKETEYNAQMSKINDDPWLSESDRTGRGAKLTTDYNNDIKTTQDSLTMAKQDIQTQLDLQSKQFDINSAVAKQALDEFNTLLSSGALAGATGADIAAITKATGISSTEIQAAIASQTEKDTPTSVTTVDDGTNQYAVTINTKTGQVISKTILAASKPVKATATDTKAQEDATNRANLISSIKNYNNLADVIATYEGVFSDEQIYDLYNTYSPFHHATETLKQVQERKFSVK